MTNTQSNSCFTQQPCSKFLTIFFFIALPIFTFYMGMVYQGVPKTENVNTPLPTTSPTLNLAKTLFPDWQLISKKTYKNFEIGSFNPSQDVSGPNVVLPSLFFVAPISSDKPQIYRDSYVVSMISDAFYNKNLFDIVGEKIYVIDSQLNSIKVFTSSYIPATKASGGRYFMDFVEVILAPKYEIGTIHSIVCENNLCAIRSAFHQEAGCLFNLSVETRKYSTPVCTSAGPQGKEYTPDKI